MVRTVYMSPQSYCCDMTYSRGTEPCFHDSHTEKGNLVLNFTFLDRMQMRCPIRWYGVVRITDAGSKQDTHGTHGALGGRTNLICSFNMTFSTESCYLHCTNACTIALVQSVWLHVIVSVPTQQILTPENFSRRTYPE